MIRKRNCRMAMVAAAIAVISWPVAAQPNPRDRQSGQDFRSRSTPARRTPPPQRTPATNQGATDFSKPHLPVDNIRQPRTTPAGQTMPGRTPATTTATPAGALRPGAAGATHGLTPAGMTPAQTQYPMPTAAGPGPRPTQTASPGTTVTTPFAAGPGARIAPTAPPATATASPGPRTAQTPRIAAPTPTPAPDDSRTTGGEVARTADRVAGVVALTTETQSTTDDDTDDDDDDGSHSTTYVLPGTYSTPMTPVPAAYTPVSSTQTLTAATPAAAPTPAAISAAASGARRCCDAIRLRNNGRIRFGKDGRYLDIAGNTLTLVVDSQRFEVHFAENIEAVFCSLIADQLYSDFTKVGSSDTRGGQAPREISASTSLLMAGADTNGGDTRPGYLFSFQRQVLQGGEIVEMSASILVDAASCEASIQLTIDGKIVEFLTRPFRSPRQMRVDVSRTQPYGPNNAADYPDWWSASIRHLLEACQWEGWVAGENDATEDEKMVFAVHRQDLLSYLAREVRLKMERSGLPANSPQRQELQEVMDALVRGTNENASLCDIVIAMQPVWNRTR